jgi:hypothetical protein
VFDRARAVGSQAIVSGTLFLSAGPGTVLPGGVTITNLAFLCGGTGAGTPLNQWFCLVDQSRNVLVKTVDDTTTAWSAGATKTLALSAPYTPTSDVAVYFGIVVVATIAPTITGVTGGVGLTGIAPIMSGSSTTGLTNPASLGGTANALTASGSVLYAFAT